MPNLKHQRITDRAVDLGNFNRLIDVAMRSYKTIFDATYFVTNKTAAGDLVSLNPDALSGLHPPFQFELFEKSLTEIAMRCGAFTRNGERLSCPEGDEGALGVSDDLNDFWFRDFPAAAQTYYISLRLEQVASPAYEYNPEIWPTELDVVALTTRPASDYFNQYIVVGWVKIDSNGDIEDFQQEWWGGNIDDIGVMPDSESLSGSPDAISKMRKTLQLNPESGLLKPHYQETQLYDVQSVGEQTYSINYFWGKDKIDAVLPGELKWAAIDTHDRLDDSPYASQRSIEIKSDVLQVFGVDLATKYEVPFVDIDGSSNRWLGWEYICTWESDPEVDSSSYDDFVTSLTVTSSGAVEIILDWYDRVVTVADGRIDIGAASYHQETVYASINWVNAGPPDEWYLHENLDYTNIKPAGVGLQNYDHDERYPVIGSTYTGASPGSGVGGVWFQNIGRGNSAGSGSADALAIDLTNMRLHRTTTYYSVDWNTRDLFSKDTGAGTGDPWHVNSNGTYRVAMGDDNDWGGYGFNYSINAFKSDDTVFARLVTTTEAGNFYSEFGGQNKSVIICNDDYGLYVQLTSGIPNLVACLCTEDDPLAGGSRAAAWLYNATENYTAIFCGSIGGTVFYNGTGFELTCDMASPTDWAFSARVDESGLDDCYVEFGDHSNKHWAGQFVNDTISVHLATRTGFAGGVWGVDVTAGDINLDTGQGYYVNAIQVVTDQQAAEADITVTGAARDGDVRTKVNNILAKLRTHGLIAT